VSAVEQHAVPDALGSGTVFVLRAIDHPNVCVLQCVVVCCSALQGVAGCCRVLQGVAV